jgi:hypothetical protein
MDEDCPFVLEDVATPADAGVVAGGDGVASLSTLLALLDQKKEKKKKLCLGFLLLIYNEKKSYIS